MRRVFESGGGFSAALLCAALLFAPSALAEPPPAEPAAAPSTTATAASAPATPPTAPSTAPPAVGQPEPWETAKAERRYGFTMGLATGLGLGYARGYPNEYGKIGDPGSLARTSGAGAPVFFWFGGALADWFSFGLGGESGGFGSSKLYSGGGAFLFHIEAFPAYTLGGGWRDFGVLADFGAGSASITRKSDGTQIASSGAISIGGAGVFWEPWRIFGDHVATGPIALWQYQDSESMARHLVLIGIRAAYYGGVGVR